MGVSLFDWWLAVFCNFFHIGVEAEERNAFYFQLRLFGSYAAELKWKMTTPSGKIIPPRQRKIALLGSRSVGKESLLSPSLSRFCDAWGLPRSVAGSAGVSERAGMKAQRRERCGLVNLWANERATQCGNALRRRGSSLHHYDSFHVAIKSNPLEIAQQLTKLATLQESHP